MTNKSDEIHTIDLETSIKNRGEDAIGTDKASPHSPKNDVVYIGLKQFKNTETYAKRVTSGIPYIDTEITMLVGQNIKFDLLYLMRHPKTRAWMKTGKVWDTQIVEYLITGQKEKYAALGDRKDKEGNVTKQGLATKYGGHDKDDRLKEFWDADVDTEDIPPSIILDYLKGDVTNTELVFKCQLKIVKELGLLPLVHTQMEALLATTEMEYNGLWFDKHEALEEMTKLSMNRNTLHSFLCGHMAALLPKGTTTNPDSNDQVSTMIFGGTIKENISVPVLDDEGKEVRFKSGKQKGEVKYRKQELLHNVKGYGEPVHDEDWKTKKEGVYSVDEEVMLYLINNSSNTSLRAFCEVMLNYRRVEKELSTYYKPYISLCWPHDNCIHGKISHCGTDTGRTSSSSPNLQNVTNQND